MIKNMKKGIPSIMKAGTKVMSGLEEAVFRNVKACKALSDITRTSLGPIGMNKMLVNRLNRVSVTSDCATILTEMDVEHPAAKLIVMAAQMQEREIGDGSNFVIVFAGELLSKAEELIRMGLHPSDILAGYLKAGRKALELLEDADSGLVQFTIQGAQLRDPELLRKGLFAAISSKQHGYEQLLIRLVVDAALSVMPEHALSFNVDNVRVVKLLGGSLEQSEVIRGLVIESDTEGSVKKVKDARLAIYTCSLTATDTETKGTVVLESAKELLGFNSSEEKHLENIISTIARSGANVVITGGTIDELGLHYIEKYKLMAVKITSKYELRRICRATKARPGVVLAPLNPEQLGHCSNVFVKEYGGAKVLIFQQDAKDVSPVATILLRASTENVLDDVENAVDDGVNTVKAMVTDGRFLAGGGAVDIELGRRLTEYASTYPRLEQYAMKAFAEALEVIPRTLAENAGLSAIDILSQLYAAHEDKKATFGIDVKARAVRDMAGEGVFDLLPTRAQALRLATDAAVTVLRVDQIIMAKPAGIPSGAKKGHWDDQED